MWKSMYQTGSLDLLRRIWEKHNFRKTKILKQFTDLPYAGDLLFIISRYNQAFPFKSAGRSWDSGISNVGVDKQGDFFNRSKLLVMQILFVVIPEILTD